MEEMQKVIRFLVRKYRVAKIPEKEILEKTFDAVRPLVHKTQATDEFIRESIKKEL